MSDIICTTQSHWIPFPVDGSRLENGFVDFDMPHSDESQLVVFVSYEVQYELLDPDWVVSVEELYQLRSVRLHASQSVVHLFIHSK